MQHMAAGHSRDTQQRHTAETLQVAPDNSQLFLNKLAVARWGEVGGRVCNPGALTNIQVKVPQACEVAQSLQPCVCYLRSAQGVWSLGSHSLSIPSFLQQMSKALSIPGQQMQQAAPVGQTACYWQAYTLTPNA